MSTESTNETNDGLTDEEMALLEEMKTALALQASLPESERAQIVNPDKFASAIGFDDDGQPCTGAAAKWLYEELAKDSANKPSASD